MDAAWETHEAPAPLSLFAIPNEAERKNDYEISVPRRFGLMGTRSTSQEIPGIHPLLDNAQERIIEGAQAVELLTALRKAPGDQDLQKRFNEGRNSLGYGLLLKKYTSDISQATPEQMRQAALSTIPTVTPMYWSIRLKVACGLISLVVFLLATISSLKDTIACRKGLLRVMLLALPLPWIACELGWFVAEYGRQPWSIYEVLPVDLSVSSLSSTD